MESIIEFAGALPHSRRLVVSICVSDLPQQAILNIQRPDRVINIKYKVRASTGPVEKMFMQIPKISPKQRVAWIYRLSYWRTCWSQ